MLARRKLVITVVSRLPSIVVVVVRIAVIMIMVRPKRVDVKMRRKTMVFVAVSLVNMRQAHRVRDEPQRYQQQAYDAAEHARSDLQPSNVPLWRDRDNGAYVAQIVQTALQGEVGTRGKHRRITGRPSCMRLAVTGRYIG